MGGHTGTLSAPAQKWDMDRDVVLLRDEVANVLASAALRPAEYELQEAVQADGSFSTGKVLLRLYLR